MAPHGVPEGRVRCYILVMILSTPQNTADREVLRRNSYLAYQWLYNRTEVDFRHVFVLGRSGDGAVEEAVRREALLHRDLLVGGFPDSYDNLSEKVVWGFREVLARFSFSFCVKVDEDSFLNLTYLAAYLASVDPAALGGFYAGKPREGDREIPQSGKFQVSESEIGRYVRYNLGGGYILSGEAMRRVLHVHDMAVISVIVWEDVYIGTLAYLASIQPTRIYHYYVSRFHPFCTDHKSILLHHTPPLLQAKMLTFYDKHGYYCDKELSEEQTRLVLDNYSLTYW